VGAREAQRRLRHHARHPADLTDCEAATLLGPRPPEPMCPKRGTFKLAIRNFTCVKYCSQGCCLLPASLQPPPQAGQPPHRIAIVCKEGSGAILATASSQPTITVWPVLPVQPPSAVSIRDMHLRASGQGIHQPIDCRHSYARDARLKSDPLRKLRGSFSLSARGSHTGPRN